MEPVGFSSLICWAMGVDDDGRGGVGASKLSMREELRVNGSVLQSCLCEKNYASMTMDGRRSNLQGSGLRCVDIVVMSLKDKTVILLVLSQYTTAYHKSMHNRHLHAI
mmetsp:Transcript_31577/g.66151  ORF Transcript_31577/g.66151 Transcript_31577/m.66151 type:complete len:108 (-) Transcript_31577:1837-2160(-)